MSEEDQKQQQAIQEKLRILLRQEAKLREEYLDPPTHLSSFIGANGQQVGFYKHPENKTLFVEIGRLRVVEGDTKKITLNNGY